MMHLACQKNLETPKLSGNGRLGSFVITTEFWCCQIVLTSQMHHRKRTIFFIAFGLPKKFGNTKTQW
ncbi:unnamed protein product [Blepharisma stoltei]|uniref:Uncharacterized protein n=1 Tax=Blepharisma stoltei TaxID=1481888 RepID=A0AAU9JA09_9CILI|nr:unnamed protein product [Blepharisma stoltei]